MNNRFFLATAFGLAAATALAQTAAMPDVDAFAVGEEWVWREFDNRTKLESPAPGRRVVIAEERGVRKAIVDGVPRALVYPYVFEPSAKPWRVWPLELGKQWSTDVDFVSASGAPGNLKQTARVVAHEEVVVPAGTFMTFRIEYDGHLNLGSFSGRMLDTFWYAPAARADVKHVRRVGRTDFTRELVKYPAPAERPATAQAPAAAGAEAVGTPQAQSAPAVAK